MLRQELAQLLNMSLLMIDKWSNQNAAGQISQSLFFARDNLMGIFDDGYSAATGASGRRCWSLVK
jgi:hypothetical protein